MAFSSGFLNIGFEGTHAVQASQQLFGERYVHVATQNTFALGWPRLYGASLAALFAAALAATSCDTRLAAENSSVSRIDLTPTSASLPVGATLTLSAVVLDANGNTLRDRRVVWASEQETIASVSQSGVVIALAPGEVRIAASSGGKSASATITVSPRPVSLVRITPGSATISVSSSIALTVEALDASGAEVVGRPVTWASFDPTIAVVSTSGVVAALSVGSVTITATVDGRVGTAAISVAPQPVAAVSITPTLDSVMVGARALLHATALDAQNRALPDRFVLWSSNNPAVVTVSSEGEVFALAIGSARVRAAVEGKFAEAIVVVIPVPVARIVVSPNQLTLLPGESRRFVAQALDAQGRPLAQRTYAWSSADASVATVNQLGDVTAVSAGTVSIAAATGGQTGSATVTVNSVEVSSIVVSPKAVNLTPPQTLQLSVQLFDSVGASVNASGRPISWISRDPTVASVSGSGQIGAVSAGSVYVVVSTPGTKGTLYDSVNVTVSSPPTSSMTVLPRTATVYVGGTSAIRAVLVSGGVVNRSSAVTWQSRAPAILSVSSVSGLADSATVTGISLGSTYVVASDRTGLSDSSLVLVAPVPVAAVSVSPASTRLAVSATTQLSAVARDSAGGTLTRTISWISLAPTVATVSSTGLVTAAAAGSATVEARAVAAGVNGVDVVGSAAVTVTPPIQAAVNSVLVTSPRTWVVPGDTMHLTVVLRDAQNNVIAGRQITFSSSNGARMTVDTAGVVSGVGTSGASDITATSEGKSGKVHIDAVDAVAAISVVGPQNSASDLIIPRGAKKRYTVTVKDGRGNGISGVTTNVSTSKPSLLTLQKTVLSTNSSGQAHVDISAGSTVGLAMVSFVATRAGAIPPGSAGYNNPVALLPIVVP